MPFHNNIIVSIQLWGQYPKCTWSSTIPRWDCFYSEKILYQFSCLNNVLLVQWLSCKSTSNNPIIHDVDVHPVRVEQKYAAGTCCPILEVHHVIPIQVRCIWYTACITGPQRKCCIVCRWNEFVCSPNPSLTRRYWCVNMIGCDVMENKPLRVEVQ